MGDEHDLERDEEQEQVARGERGDGAALDGQVARRERAGPAGHRPDPHEVPADEQAEQGGQEHQRRRDAVDREVRRGRRARGSSDASRSTSPAGRS